MPGTEPPKPRRRRYPRFMEGTIPKGRVLRPFDKWLLNIFTSDRWVDSREGGEWLKTLHELAAARGCRLICDSMYHWRESVYIVDYRKKGPAILAGGAGTDTQISTVILHELGHHILESEHRHPEGNIAGEEAAWHAAQQLALEHRLPLEPRVKRTALYSYRYRKVCELTAGSKRKNKIRPLPKSWQLEGSRRTSEASAKPRQYSLGKRGRRHAKRHIKKTTARAERRRPVSDD